MLDIVIKNGMVVDGSGQPAYKSDVGVVDGRIALLAGAIEQEAKCTIEAQGLHVAPGFIDPHTHSDFSLLANRFAESKIRQGVTTEIIGNCGISQAPIAGDAVNEAKGIVGQFQIDATWRSMAEFLDQIRNPGVSVNVVSLIGHNTIRGSVLGYGNVQPDRAQQAQMERLVEEAMEQGARGLSSGLIYPPGFYAQIDELIGLASAAAKYGGIYTTHMRNEASTVLDAVDEALTISEKSGAPLQISHLKLEGYRNWGNVEQLLAKIDSARARGVDVSCDQYPYTAYGTFLSIILPLWALEGGASTVGKRMKSSEVRSRLREDWNADPLGWEERGGMHVWSDFLITNCAQRPEVQGRFLTDIASEDGKDPLEVVFDLIEISEGMVSCACFCQDENNVRRIMQHPLVAIGSDSSALAPYGVTSQGKPHPRFYGTFPRVLGRYVREEKVIKLEEAVKKMTSQSAERFGLSGRGVIREGAWADLALFDTATVAEKATYTDPHQYPAGIPYVIVNGEVVINNGQHTEALPGRVL